MSDLAAPPPYPGAPQATSYQYHFGYCDGFGREIQRKAQVAPGPGDRRRPAVSPRWAGLRLDDLRQQGPAGPAHTSRSSRRRTASSSPRRPGSAPSSCYDPPGRVVATLHPDNSWDKDGVRPVVASSTGTATTRSLIADPRADADVGGYFQRLLGTGTFTSWYELRIGGTYGATAQDQAAQQDAAQKAADGRRHAGRHAPSTRSGRACLAVADNGGGARYPVPHRATTPRASRWPSSTRWAGARRSTATANPLAGRRIPVPGRHRHGGQPAVPRQRRRRRAPRPGQRRRASRSAAGTPAATRSACVYDAAQRPDRALRQHRRRAGDPDRAVRLRRGPARRRTCAAGCSAATTWPGTSRTASTTTRATCWPSARQLAADYHQAVDWTPLAGLTTAAQLDAAATAAGLVPTGDGGRDRFAGSTVYDALNRPVQVVTPHNAAMRPDVHAARLRRGGAAQPAWTSGCSRPRRRPRCSIRPPPTGMPSPASSTTRAASGSRSRSATAPVPATPTTRRPSG